jgi:hypothetical protein
LVLLAEFDEVPFKFHQTLTDPTFDADLLFELHKLVLPAALSIIGLALESHARLEDHQRLAKLSHALHQAEELPHPPHIS